MTEKQNKLGNRFRKIIHHQTSQIANHKKSIKRIKKLRSFFVTKWRSFYLLKNPEN